MAQTNAVVELTNEAKQERVSVVDFLRAGARVYRRQEGTEKNEVTKSQIRSCATCLDLAADHIEKGKHRS
jgi:hypothetical protein